MRHVLPFFAPFDGADAGFDPIDRIKVDERLGLWDGVTEPSRTHGHHGYAIVSRMSWQSAQFSGCDGQRRGSEYYPMFLTFGFVFPHGATEEDLVGIYRPRLGLPFTHYNFAGKTRLVRVGFTLQQADVDADSAKGRGMSGVYLRPDGRQPCALVSMPWAMAPKRPEPAAS